jgi:hypothetical protein
LTTFSVRRELPAFHELPFVSAFPDGAAEFAHALEGDDRLRIESIATLADRLCGSVVFDHADQPEIVPSGPPKGRLTRPGDLIRNLEGANAWLTILNAEQDPDYAELMNVMLDRLELNMGASSGELCNRGAFIIVSSPNSVTPVHFDLEHSCLMQVSGSRELILGRFEGEAEHRREVDRYFGSTHGRLSFMPREVGRYHIAPGRGVYIPPYTSHWLRNGPAVSVSMTLTYFTTASLRTARIEDLNSRLRRLHLSPRPPGDSAAVDAMKIAVVRAGKLAGKLRAAMTRSQRNG